MCFPVNFAKFLRIPFYKTLLGDCFCFLLTQLYDQKTQWYFSFKTSFLKTPSVAASEEKFYQKRIISVFYKQDSNLNDKCVYLVKLEV